MLREKSDRPGDRLILIVDDDPEVCQLLITVIRAEGFRVEFALTAEDALGRSRELKPDLIVLDLMLPVKGGFDLVHQLQSSDTAGIPLLVISALFTDKSTIKMLLQEPNVIGFFPKPINPTAVASRLHEELKTRPLAQEAYAHLPERTALQ